MVVRGGSIKRLVGQYHHLESDASDYREPVEVTEKGGSMEEFWHAEHEACCSVLDTLHRFDHFWQGVQPGASCSSQAGDDERLDQELMGFPCEEGPNPAD